jgi:preprotein translocase subunit SecA
MEDDLMRIFGGERMRNIMKTLRVPEDMPIENRIIARSIESAQKKVEEHNFDIRKHLVEYDDVINKHRAAIYRRRREILNIAGADLTPSPSPSQGEGSRGSFASAESLRPLADDSAAAGELQDIIKDMIAEEIALVVNAHTGGEDTGVWNVQEIYETTKTILPVATDFKNKLADIAKNAKPEMARQKITDFILEKVDAAYVELAKTINELVPQTESAQPRSAMQSIEQQILIRAIDTLWTEHLDVMDGMRRGISLRGYGQRDPLVEYKKEAFRLFSELNELIRKQVVYSIFKVGDVSQFVAPTLLQQAQRFIAPTANADSFANLKEGNGETATNAPVVTQKPRDSEGHKVGRNDLCPCGSGKKYKKCHGT